MISALTAIPKRVLLLFIKKFCFYHFFLDEISNWRIRVLTGIGDKKLLAELYVTKMITERIETRNGNSPQQVILCDCCKW